jgi:hypothetical protein
VKQEPIGLAYKFQPRQIVCLEHENTRLYAEVIDVVVSRQICWVRPLILAVSGIDNEPLSALSPEQCSLYDLHQEADLLWPVVLFRPALDIEVVPLLVHLNNPDREQQSDNSDIHKLLNCFIRKVWQAYKSSFQAS